MVSTFCKLSDAQELLRLSCYSCGIVLGVLNTKPLEHIIESGKRVNESRDFINNYFPRHRAPNVTIGVGKSKCKPSKITTADPNGLLRRELQDLRNRLPMPTLF